MRAACLAVLVAAAACGSPAQPRAVPPGVPLRVHWAPTRATPLLGADELMQRVTETYRSLPSYQDDGVLLRYWKDEGGAQVLRFWTYYRAPGDFRFEWETHHPYRKLRRIKHRRVVWSNSQGTFTYWDASQTVRTDRDVHAAIHAAAGVSSGTITRVPAFFVDRSRLEAVENLSLLEPQDFEGTPCLRVHGTYFDRDLEIWIGRDDFLIRRIVTVDQAGGDLPTQQEIHRHIRIGGSIADAVFQFTPPSGSGSGSASGSASGSGSGSASGSGSGSASGSGSGSGSGS